LLREAQYGRLRHAAIGGLWGGVLRYKGRKGKGRKGKGREGKGAGGEERKAKAVNLQPFQGRLNIRKFEKDGPVRDLLIVKHEADAPNTGREADVFGAGQVV